MTILELLFKGRGLAALWAAYAASPSRATGTAYQIAAEPWKAQAMVALRAASAHDGLWIDLRDMVIETGKNLIDVAQNGHGLNMPTKLEELRDNLLPSGLGMSEYLPYVLAGLGVVLLIIIFR